MVAVLQALLPVVALGVAGLLVVAVVARRWRVAVVVGVLFCVCTAVVVPSLLEITPAAVERLRIAGLDSILPDSVGRSGQDAGGTIVRSRIPLTLVEPGLDHVPPRAFDEPVVSMHRPDGDVALRAVHALPPSPSGAADWRSGLADLPAWCERQVADQPPVMAGDFSSWQGHSGFRAGALGLSPGRRDHSGHRPSRSLGPAASLMAGVGEIPTCDVTTSLQWGLFRCRFVLPDRVPGSAWAGLRQDGSVTTPLVALAAYPAPRAVGALGAVVTAASFGVGRGFAALVAVFAFLFGLMVLGGHLRASRQRKRRDNRH